MYVCSLPFTGGFFNDYPVQEEAEFHITAVPDHFSAKFLFYPPHSIVIR
jgi:hypothetical protein